MLLSTVMSMNPYTMLLGPGWTDSFDGANANSSDSLGDLDMTGVVYGNDGGQTVTSPGFLGGQDSSTTGLSSGTGTSTNGMTTADIAADFQTTDTYQRNTPCDCSCQWSGMPQGQTSSPGLDLTNVIV